MITGRDMLYYYVLLVFFPPRSAGAARECEHARGAAVCMRYQLQPFLAVSFFDCKVSNTTFCAEISVAAYFIMVRMSE